MLVTTVAIMAIVAFGVVGWTVVRGDDDSRGGSADGWDEIALVDRSTGAVTIVDDEGEVVRNIVGRGRVTDVYTEGDRLALIGSTQIVLEGGEAADAIPTQRNNTVTPIRTSNGMHLVIGTTTGGNVIIVDLETGEQLDVAVIAEQQTPRLFSETIRWSDDGTRFAVADANVFQTIVVEAGSEEPAFFAAQPIALDGDLVATGQVVGRQADVELFDRERAGKGRVPTEIPAGGVMVDGDLLMVSTGGGIFRVEAGSAEAQRLGEVAVPSGGTVSWVRPTHDGTRLVVAGATFQAVIDLDGRTLFTTTFTTPIDVDVPRPDWTCLPVGGDGTYHSIVSLETGEQIADLSDTEVTGTSSDGCTAIGTRGGVYEVSTADGVVTLGRLRSAALGPDGRTVVRTTTTGLTEILGIDDELQVGDPVDLSAVAPANAIVAFLDET